MANIIGRLKGSAGLLLGLLLFAGIIYFLSGADSLAAMGRIRISHFVAITVITLAINGVAALRWKLLLSGFGIVNLHWRMLFEIITLAKLTGHTFSDFFGDIAVRIHGLHPEKVTARGVLVSVVAEKIFEVLLVLSVLAGWFLPAAAGVSGYSGLLFIVTALALASQMPVKIAFWWLSHKKEGAEGNGLIAPGFLLGLQVMALSLLRYSLVTARYATIFCMLGITVEPLEVFYGTSFAHLGLIASITPGGIGLVEAGWTGYMAFLGLATGVIAQFLLVQRVSITICVAFSTAIVFAMRKVNRQREVHR